MVVLRKGNVGRKKKGDESSVDFTFCSSGPDEGVSVRGSIGVISGDSVSVVPCTGHVIATDPDDGDVAAVILDCPEKGLIPCCCPVSLLDEATREALIAFHTRQYSGRTTRYSRVVCNISFKSSPAVRDGVEGHLLTDAVRGLKGRVVDEAMLAALKAGCLRKGEHSTSNHHGSNAFYTLDRAFSANYETIKRSAHTIVRSSSGARLFPTTRKEDVISIMRCGQSAVQGLLVYHHNVQSAIERLDRAHAIGEPTTYEQHIQMALGGTVDSLVMGRFLACERMSNEPNIGVRCACGFRVAGLKPGEGLLRIACHRG